MDIGNQVIGKVISDLKTRLSFMRQEKTCARPVTKLARVQTESSTEDQTFLDASDGFADTEWGELGISTKELSQLRPNPLLKDKKQSSLHPARPSLIRLDESARCQSTALKELGDILQTSNSMCQTPLFQKKKKSLGGEKLQKVPISGKKDKSI